MTAPPEGAKGSPAQMAPPYKLGVPPHHMQQRAGSERILRPMVGHSLMLRRGSSSQGNLHHCCMPSQRLSRQRTNPPSQIQVQFPPPHIEKTKSSSMTVQRHSKDISCFNSVGDRNSPLQHSRSASPNHAAPARSSLAHDHHRHQDQQLN